MGEGVEAGETALLCNWVTPFLCCEPWCEDVVLQTPRKSPWIFTFILIGRDLLESWHHQEGAPPGLGKTQNLSRLVVTQYL